MEGCDAAIHGAAMYEVGIPESEHQAMYEANVIGTENVLRAALEAKLGKVVYISTVGAFGNTKGQVVDEAYEHPGTAAITSYYEETKVEAHRLAKRLIAEEGLPCVIVQPGGVYGPDDHSALGRQMNQFLAGTDASDRLPRARLQHGPRRRRRRRASCWPWTGASRVRPTCSAGRSRPCAS